MSRYILVSRKIKKGELHTASHLLEEYFELGWELSTTHLDTKFLLSESVYNKSDIIVTHSGREFFYENLFDNVIQWNDFEKLDKNGHIIIDMVTNSVNYFFHKHLCNPNLVWNNQKIKDDILFSFNYSDIKPVNDYVCLVYRKRSHDASRNMDDGYFNSIISYIKTKGLDIYVVGYGSEKFTDNKQVFYVDLRDWATLVNNEKCKFIVTTMTGPTNLLNFCGNKETNIFIIDKNNSRGDGKGRIVMGECLNFKNLKYNFVGNPDIHELIKIIEMNVYSSK